MATKRVVAVPPGQALWVNFAAAEGKITVLSGQFQCFGAPTQPYATYVFEAGASTTFVALGSGCRAEVAGDFTHRLTVPDGDAQRIHAALSSARLGPGPGPVVLVLGDVDTGKTTLARTLVNAAAAEPEAGVVYVDVDVGQTSLGCPGTVAASFVQAPSPPDVGFGAAVPLAFFFGSKALTPSTSGRFLDQCSQLHRAVEAVRGERAVFQRGGVVVNSFGWVAGAGLEAQLQLIDIFRVTHLVVTGGNASLVQHLRNVARSSVRGMAVLDYRGMADHRLRRPTEQRKVDRSRVIARYFAGTASRRFAPTRMTIRRGALRVLDALSLEPVCLQKDVPRLALCAVAHGPDAKANIAGYVVVLEASAATATFLVPAPGPLPSMTLLVSRDIALLPGHVPAFAQS